MKKAAVLGVGRMGQAISWCMKKLGYYVVGMDSYEGASAGFRKHIEGSEGIFYVTDQNNADKMMETFILHEKPDVVISSLPYHQTEAIGYWCIDNGFRYCDLGGRVDVSHNINKYAEEKAKAPVMTDLGLAPGWINIMAEWGYSEMHGEVKDVSMMVGGLPAQQVNHPLDYIVTWSTDGLINEYRDDCEVLTGGNVINVPGMRGYEKVFFKCLDRKLEAFYTSGGASHSISSMKERGVKNCSYKTLRYLGHRDAVQFLIRRSELSDDCLRQIFERGCRRPEGVHDMVLMKTKLSGERLKWSKELVVFPQEGFSAMQRATSSPISAVASLMAEGELEGDKEQHRDYWTKYPTKLTYKDIPFDKFNSKLEQLGLDLDL